MTVQGFASLLDSTNCHFEHALNVSRFGGHVPFQFTEATGDSVNGLIDCQLQSLLFVAHSAKPTGPELQSRYRFRGFVEEGGRPVLSKVTFGYFLQRQ